MNDKIEIGEYVRTTDGIIQKCIDVDNSYIYADDILSYNFQGDIEIPNCYIDKTRIVKHSKSLIDLVQIGDFVNGSIVWEILEDERVHTMTGALLSEDDIKTILTKEIYEQNCYKVEE